MAGLEQVCSSPGPASYRKCPADLYHFVSVQCYRGGGQWCREVGIDLSQGLAFSTDDFVVLHVIPEPQVPPLNRRMALLSELAQSVLERGQRCQQGCHTPTEVPLETLYYQMLYSHFLRTTQQEAASVACTVFAAHQVARLSNVQFFSVLGAQDPLSQWLKIRAHRGKKQKVPHLSPLHPTSPSNSHHKHQIGICGRRASRDKGQ